LTASDHGYPKPLIDHFHITGTTRLGTSYLSPTSRPPLACRCRVTAYAAVAALLGAKPRGFTGTAGSRLSSMECNYSRSRLCRMVIITGSPSTDLPMFLPIRHATPATGVQISDT
jgi:hypothetical protein